MLGHRKAQAGQGADSQFVSQWHRLLAALNDVPQVIETAVEHGARAGPTIGHQGLGDLPGRSDHADHLNGH